MARKFKPPWCFWTTILNRPSSSAGSTFSRRVLKSGTNVVEPFWSVSCKRTAVTSPHVWTYPSTSRTPLRWVVWRLLQRRCKTTRTGHVQRVVRAVLPRRNASHSTVHVFVRLFRLTANKQKRYTSGREWTGSSLIIETANTRSLFKCSDLCHTDNNVVCTGGPIKQQFVRAYVSRSINFSTSQSRWRSDTLDRVRFISYDEDYNVRTFHQNSFWPTRIFVRVITFSPKPIGKNAKCRRPLVTRRNF
jgi:hypothetical protein